MNPAKILALGILLLGFPSSCSRSRRPEAGNALPVVMLKDARGHTISSDALKTPFVALFFDPECEPCRRTVTAIGDLQPALPDQRLVILTRREAAVPLSLLIRFPVFALSEKDWRETLAISGTPTLFFVGRDGRLVDSITGRRSRRLLKEKFHEFFSREIS